MAQWGQGYQYPIQTGFNPQQQQFQQQPFNQGQALPPQLAAQRPPGFQQPQQPGFGPQPTGFVQPQQTGFIQPNQTGFQPAFQQRAPPPPVPPLPQQFQQQQPSAFLNAQQQPNRFLNSSPGPLNAQPTGFPGPGASAMRPLVPQMTGFVDPRLQMMSGAFLPANMSVPYNPAGAPLLQHQPSNLQQSFQQHNQAQRGTAAPNVPWALSKAEKKSYDQIFRAWDQRGEGFISGQTALEVFGQSGLDKNELAKIWSLADGDNRGKLNLAEFHVAMGLIYRRLNGNEVPDELPAELVPPSHRDLDTSVNFLKDILKNDPRARSPSAFDPSGAGQPVSKLKERSFTSTGSSSALGAGGRRQDATVYKYNDDSSPPGGFYQPRSRHVDRSAVRTASSLEGENAAAADLSDMKRQLEGAAQMLERTAEERAGRTAEDEGLEREMGELRWRVKRVQEDLEYVSARGGGRGAGAGAGAGGAGRERDEERRRLERELMGLMHERLPELERKIRDREERRRREAREWERERDRRNERFGRFNDDDERASSAPRYDRDDERDRERAYRSYDRDDKDRDRDRGYDRDRPYSRNRERDREYDRPRSPSPARSPPPPAPPAPTSTLTAPPPPAPARAPTASPAPALKNMTPEERKAFIQAEAQRRMQERMAALGVVSSPSPSSASASGYQHRVDSAVEDRLAKEKKEAEEKARAAERAAEERERVRRERLEGEKAAKGGGSPTTTAPNASTQVPAPVPPAPKPAPAPPPPKARAPAPPPPRKAPAPRPSATTPHAPPPPAPPAQAKVEMEVDPVEEELRAREAALRRAREERLERMRRMEEEEMEAAKRMEEEYRARRQQFAQASAPTAPTALAPAPAPPSVAAPAPPPPAPPAPEAPQAPPPPPPPAPAVSTPSASVASPPARTNPFSRMMRDGTESASASAAPTPTPSSTGTASLNGSTNPFFKPPSAPPTSAPASAPTSAPSAAAPPLSKSPAPPAIKTTYHTAPSSSEDDWDDVHEKDADEDSEDELDSSRDNRNKLAKVLFGNILPPPSRPQSAAPAGAGALSEPSTPVAPPPPPPPTAPSAPGAPPPTPPPAPPFEPAPPVGLAAPAPTGDRNALLSAIQMGARLKKAQTNDRSAAALSGKILGDAAPPPHINAAPRPPSPSQPQPRGEELAMGLPPMMAQGSSRSSNRESVDWYAGLAADGGAAAAAGERDYLPSTVEEEEEEEENEGEGGRGVGVPHIQVDAPADDIDRTVEYRVRSLYPYEGQRPEDLAFGENLVLTAHPSKSGGDWWYGTLVRDGKSGFFPKTYVEKMDTLKAKALYAYTGSNPDELAFEEGDDLTIVDRSDVDWWKAERGGVVFIVPAAYLEVVEVNRNIYHSSQATPITARPDDFDRSGPPSSDGKPPDPLSTAVTSDRGSGSDDSDEEEESDWETASETFTESDSPESDEESQTEEQRKAEREARAVERQRVLEAAGLILKSDVKPPPRLVRAGSRRNRRPPPAVPERPLQPPSPSNLPPEPDVNDTSLRLDDAYERYEHYRQANPSMNRLSTASVDTSNSLSTSPSASSIPRSPSAEGESRSHSSFFNFFGRSRTPAGDEEPRTMPVISGPIPIRDSSSSGLDTADDAGFGLTWASLVDKSALEEIPPNERRRQEAIFELIATELAYVRDLQLIVEVFYGSLLPYLDEKAVAVIFANVEDILLVNTSFMSALEERQKECRLYIDRIGDLLHDNMANMGVYMEYCVNQSTATRLLQSLRKANPELSAQLQRLRDDPAVRNLDLSSYLLIPMQRITRYPLLIRQVIHYTEPTASDYKWIQRALDMAEKILHHINETIREQEGRERLKVISNDLWIGKGRLDLTAPTRHMGPRKLLREGILMKAKSGRRIRAFLCSDILVLTEESAKSLYRMPIPLLEVQVKETRGHRDDLTFRLVLSYPRGGDSIALKATSARDCQLWMRAIDTASRRSREAEKKAARKSLGY